MDRRSFLSGAFALIAAPAIVRAASLMPVRGIVMPVYGHGPAMFALDLIEKDGFDVFPTAHSIDFLRLYPGGITRIDSNFVR